MQSEEEDSILRPRPTSLPSLWIIKISTYYTTLYECLDSRLHVYVFTFQRFPSFFFFFFSRSCWLFFHEQCISVGPMHYLRDLQISFFSNFFIKNWFYRTVHTFKYYFAIIFSIFSKISYIQINLILSKRVKIDKAKQSDCKVQSYK